MTVTFPYTTSTGTTQLHSDWRSRFTDEQLGARVTAKISSLQAEKSALESQLADAAADAVRTEAVGRPFEFAKTVRDIAAALDEVNGQIAFFEAAADGFGVSD